jgi:uncharacterized RDD family membrane protein YckC
VWEFEEKAIGKEPVMLERKGLGIRFGAAVIDAVLCAIVGNVAIAVAGGIVGTIVSMLVMLAYPLIEIARAQSPGKMILKLKVTSEDGSPATREQLIQRGVIRWSGNILTAVLGLLAFVVPALAFLGSLGQLALGIALLVLSWQTINTTRQGYWDVRAKTAVMGPVGAVAVPGFPVQPVAAEAPTAAAATPPQA